MTQSTLPAPRVTTSPGLTAATAGGHLSFRWPTRTERAVILFLVGFLLVFPKGGIKLAGVPITWGYVGLGLVCLWLPIAVAFGYRARIEAVRLLILLLLVPFQVVIWGALLMNGVTDTGFAISLVTSFFFVPIAAVLILGIHLDRLDLKYLFPLIRFGVLAVSIYGILLFFYRLRTGTFIEIPYLTVNAGDVGGLEFKYIDRGGIFKLISTYNNGNIYGISILMLLPLYAWLEPSPAKQGIVKLSLLLTLSRTVWVGMIAHEILQRLYVRRVTVRTMILLVLSLMLVLAGVGYALHLLEVDIGFLFDRRLGGRLWQLDVLSNPTILPEKPFEIIAEIVYLSVLQNFGMVGLATFVVGMSAPVFLHLVGALAGSHTQYKRALASGLLIYLLIAMSDGAMLYIPVMVFYWFVVSLLLSRNESFREWGAYGQEPTNPMTTSRIVVGSDMATTRI